MKYKDGNYLQLSREIFRDDKFQEMSINAKWLYVVLCELEHQFIGKNDYFFRSNEDLAKDAGMSLATLKRAKKELEPFIQTWQVQWKDPKVKKPSRKHVTAYRIPKISKV